MHGDLLKGTEVAAGLASEYLEGSSVLRALLHIFSLCSFPLKSDPPYALSC